MGRVASALESRPAGHSACSLFLRSHGPWFCTYARTPSAEMRVRSVCTPRIEMMCGHVARELAKALSAVLRLHRSS
eukprot:105213-Rhodomonas_salina.2